MKFKEERPLANPEAALAKLLEIANALEVDHAGRLSVGAINHAFLTAGGNGAEYGAAMHRAVADGWLETHPSGAYVKLTQKDTAPPWGLGAVIRKPCRATGPARTEP